MRRLSALSMGTDPPAARYCGCIALVGSPNVGKSSLLNRLVGAHLAPVTPKPQTTRQNILGILTEHDAQFVFIDTPGIHRHQPHQLNRLLNKNAQAALEGIDVVVFMVDRNRWGADEDQSLARIQAVNTRSIACINKIDLLPDKAAVLPIIEALSQRFGFTEIIPISARRGDNLATLKARIRDYLPEGEFSFPPDQLTDRSEQFIAAELVREHLTYHLRDELPYAVLVETEQFALKDNVAHISLIIWVAREGHKAIVIGKQGALLKQVGTQARTAIERLLGAKVFLRLWVKVKPDWPDDATFLARLAH